MPKLHAPHQARPSRDVAPSPATARHQPVLLAEVLDALRPRPGGRYLDGTLGLGGHSGALLQAAQGQAELCGLDRDPQAIQRATEALSPWPGQVHMYTLEYADFTTALDDLGWDMVDGALVDLGVSSLQLDVAERGFSFHADAPLDMRMDMGLLAHPDQEPWAASARTLVNRADYATLKDIIARYGEDPQAGRIARAIVDARQKAPIERTGQLADIVWHSYPAKWRATARNHPATRTFQAIRMAVNDELGQLERFLDRILDRLRPGGRLAIISFHSLEDRLVKQRFRLWAKDCICPPTLPRCACDHRAEIRDLARKPIVPGEEERRANPRAASAKLRVAEKTAPGGRS